MFSENLLATMSPPQPTGVSRPLRRKRVLDLSTPKDILADSSSGGGSGAGSRAPSPSFRSGLKPPLHSQSPGSGRGISFYNALIFPLLHFSMGYRWWFGCSYAESNW